MGKRLTDDELKAIVDAEMRQSVGYFGGRLANARQKALIYYEGLAKDDLSPPEIEGRSTVVATEVRNVVLSMLPTIMEKFASGDNVVECEARSPRDEEAAKSATEYLNYLFLKKHEGNKILETAVLDALISKTGVIKVWWDNRVIETKEEYKGLSDIELAQLLDDEELEPQEHEAYPDEEAAEQKKQALAQLQQQLDQAMNAAQSNPQAAQAIPQIQQRMQQVESQPVPNLHDVTVRRTKTGGKISVENVPPEEFMISRKAKSIEDAPFVGHRVMRTQSELVAMGYKDVENITSDEGQNLFSMERVERMTWDDDMAYLTQTEAPSFDDSMRMIVVTEAYIKADRDGDGVAELLKIVKAGNRILEVEEVDVVPFAVLRPIIMPHRFFGLSVADLAMEPQRVKTNVLRAILDNLGFSTNGRYFAVEGQVNLDDLLTSRPGGVVRVKNPQAVGRLDVGTADMAGAMNMLQYMQGYTEEATGWSRTANASDDPNSLNLTATAANLASNKANQRTDMIARNLAEGIKDVFKLILKLVCQNQNQAEEVKIGGRWMTLNPREWANMFDIQISVGLGTGSKDQQVQHMLMLMQHQGMAMQAGLPFVQPDNLYNSAKKLTEALGYRNTEAFWTDPKTVPPQQRPDPEMMKMQAQTQADVQKFQAQTQLEREKMQMEIQTKVAEQQAQFEERQKELQMESERNAQQTQMQAQLEAIKLQHQSELENQRIEFDKYKAQLDAETKILVAQIGAQNAASVEGSTNPSTDNTNALAAAIQGFQAALEQMRQPKTVIRGPDGRVAGIQ